MFKKLKDKLTEEVKIPSQKFTQSMQQLAQAVVSPVSSNNATFDTASNDNFSIDGEFDDTPQGTPVKKGPSEGGVAYRGGQATSLGNSFDTGSGAGFMRVDLHQDTSTPKMPFGDTLGRLRSPSVSSFASDSSFMFPVLESSGSTYNFQSDLESCSEASESVGPNINKEQLVVAYQKIQQKYHKYKGRYSDLARHYRDLERDNKNAKHILTESQDKALRRMAELKEQCNLEKQAKAHLEEALRSDLEEKDHLIDTLKTKIKLLRSQAEQLQTEEQAETKTSVPVTEMNEAPAEDLLTGGDSTSVVSSTAAVLTPEPANSADTENVALKEKLKKLESLLHKCKEDITNKRESIKQLESDKNAANAKIEVIQQQLLAIQKREEEASLSLAKNKQTIHLELESKEDEIKKLTAQLTTTNNTVSKLQSELLHFQEDSKKELALAKVEARKPLKEELEKVLAHNKILEDRLSSKESKCKAHEDKMSEALKRLEESEAQLALTMKAKEELELKFDQETTLLREEVSQLQKCLKTSAVKNSTIEQLKPILDSVQKLHGLHKLLKDDVSNSQSENKALLDQHNQLIQEKISTIMSNLTQEHNKVLSELDAYKKESVNARESLASVSNKFVLLEQTLSSEKSDVESKMTVLEKELKKAEEKVAVLEASLESERSSHKLIEEESSKKLVLLENELSEERSKGNRLNEHIETAELSLKSMVNELNSKLSNLEEEKARLMKEYVKEKEKSNSALSSSEQLQQQLEMLTQRNGESINEMTSLTMLLDEKTALIDKLEGTVSELELSLHSAVSEKVELEDKWTRQESELVAQVAAIEKKYQEAYDRIQDISKEISISDEEKSKFTNLEKKMAEKEEQIENLLNKLLGLEADLDKASSRNSDLQKEIETFDKKCQEQTSLISELQDTNGKLMESIQQLQSDIKSKSDLIKDMEKSCAEFEKSVAQELEHSALIEKLQEEVNLSKEECGILKVKNEEAVEASSKLKELLQSKSEECAKLTQEVERLSLAQTDLAKTLQQKSDNLIKMTERITEYEDLKLKLDCMERKQMDDTDELTIQREECNKLKEIINSLQKEKIEIMETLKEKDNDMQKVVSQFESVKKELNDQSKIVEDKIEECSSLQSTLISLTSDKERLIESLKQKTSECEDKEDKLDNLAEEMKRVEELSQELHRINDDRDANVEVLSTEASSLAQKVEELTITTQELKEREVDLLGKLQVAQNLEAEYISIKQREELLLSKLNEAKTFEQELKANEEELLLKSKKINELMEENERLREAGQNLTKLIDRAKEAEAKCAKLQDDGSGLLLRIQKAEESEIRCSLLEEELDALKKEKAELSLEVEALHAKRILKENASTEKSPLVSREPVVEEPCVIKHYAELTESNQSSVADEWEHKYNQLLEQHKAAMQENADVIERLKEENLLVTSSRTVKPKERLWDRQDTSLSDGSSNGSLSLVEKLQQQLAVATNQLKESKKLHRQEVDDLRRILLNHGSSSNHVSSRSDNLEDATELEYLRNILYEYMMGKEPMILARVIAAVVKFDSDQTSKVLQKEQQRLSLLGHLGIS